MTKKISIYVYIIHNTVLYPLIMTAVSRVLNEQLHLVDRERRVQ